MVFLFCSDGLHDCVAADDITAIVTLGPDAAAVRLIQAALDAGGPDNVSVIVARVDGSDATVDDRQRPSTSPAGG
jgi:protein phosphatase